MEIRAYVMNTRGNLTEFGFFFTFTFVSIYLRIWNANLICDVLRLIA